MTLAEIELEIEELDVRIRDLRARRGKLSTERMLLRRKKYDVLLDDLFQIVQESPGIDREGIRYSFPELTHGQLSGLLTRARRNHQLIENRGTSTRPKWYPKEGASYGSDAFLQNR